MQAENRHLRWLWFIFIIGLMLRLGYALAQPTVHLFYGGDGGDSAWYLANGWGFFSGQEHGWIRGIGFYLSSTPPFFLSSLSPSSPSPFSLLSHLFPFPVPQLSRALPPYHRG